MEAAAERETARQYLLLCRVVTASVAACWSKSGVGLLEKVEKELTECVKEQRPNKPKRTAAYRLRPGQPGYRRKIKAEASVKGT
jgi:hypothetical protein